MVKSWPLGLREIASAIAVPIVINWLAATAWVALRPFKFWRDCCKTAKSEARRPLASGDNYLNSASPVSSSSGNLDIYIISKGDKVSNKAINRITR